jgi:hypothetical protein
MPLFNLFGHVTDVSNVNVPPGVTEDGDTETVQSLYTLLGAIVVVVGATVVVVVGATVVVVVGATVVVVVGATVVVVVGATVVVVVGATVVVVVGATVVVVVGATVVVVVGATVSKAIDSVELAVLPLPAESAKTPAPTEIEAVPEVPAFGVKVAVYVTPEPLKPDNDPPETVTSPTTKFTDDSDNVNVNESVPPTPNEPKPLREIETVGGVVSARVS